MQLLAFGYQLLRLFDQLAWVLLGHGFLAFGIARFGMRVVVPVMSKKERPGCTTRRDSVLSHKCSVRGYPGAEKVSLPAASWQVYFAA